MPSTKPSSTTYISTPKPITANHATGSQVVMSISAALQRFIGTGQRPRRRMHGIVVRHLNEVGLSAPNAFRCPTASALGR